LFLVLINLSLRGQKLEISSELREVPVNDFIQFAIKWENSLENFNPFTDVSITGSFYLNDGERIEVKGFCNNQDGSNYLIRFMPEKTGDYSYKISFAGPGINKNFSGGFTAISSNLKSIVEVSKNFPTHFQYRNSDHFFFWNGTTAYWLAGWKDLTIIDQCLERLASYGINRVRVAINGRSQGGDRWYEPNVIESPNFTFKLNPWVAKNPESLDEPDFDVSRMNIEHWKVFDHILSKARSLDIVVSLIFYVDGLDHACDPFKLEKMGNEFERLYYQYAINRFASYSNVMWDIANEYHLFRTPEWAEKMGRLIKESDPYHHLISVHGSGDFPFRKSDWADVVMFQSWDECGGYDFIANSLTQQQALGMPKPIVNEEYGYEGHYPPWGCGATASKERPDGRSALNRAMLAWEIYMAGGYQTTGETAEYGTGAGEDSGGGWINGRGNAKMTMLNYYQIIKNTFEKTDFHLLIPSNHLTNYGNYCLADMGKTYLLYIRNPHCRIQLPANTQFNVLKIDPLSGKEESLGVIDSNVDNNAWQYREHIYQPTVFILKNINP
jgi:hypothetical protein